MVTCVTEIMRDIFTAESTLHDREFLHQGLPPCEGYNRLCRLAMPNSKRLMH